MSNTDKTNNILFEGLSIHYHNYTVWVKPKEYNIGMYCFSAKHTAFRSKRNDWLAQNQSEATYQPTACSLSELALEKSNKVCWSSTKQTSSSSH